MEEGILPHSFYKASITFNTMLSNSGESMHPHLTADISRKVFSHSLVSIILAVGFS